VVTDVGTFGAMFSLAEYAAKDALLVTSCDSVGTKTMVASMVGRHDTVGGDLVSHCVNDILVQGARPLFFMDYMAANQLPPEFTEQLITGLAEACRRAGCALIGGEMAELPGVYREGEYDLVGFVAGTVARSRAITGDRIAPGDLLLGLASDGLHTNGYSLARKVLLDSANMDLGAHVAELGRTLGEELLRIHRCYAPALLPLLAEVEVKGMAHITGGGLPDNLVRCLPEGCRAAVNRGAWPIPPVFGLIQRLGRVPEEEMYHTFNMGVGMVLVLSPEAAESAVERLAAAGEEVHVIGSIEAGERAVAIA